MKKNIHKKYSVFDHVGGKKNFLKTYKLEKFNNQLLKEKETYVKVNIGINNNIYLDGIFLEYISKGINIYTKCGYRSISYKNIHSVYKRKRVNITHNKLLYKGVSSVSKLDSVMDKIKFWTNKNCLNVKLIKDIRNDTYKHFRRQLKYKDIQTSKKRFILELNTNENCNIIIVSGDNIQRKMTIKATKINLLTVKKKLKELNEL